MTSSYKMKYGSIGEVEDGSVPSTPSHVSESFWKSWGRFLVVSALVCNGVIVATILLSGNTNLSNSPSVMSFETVSGSNELVLAASNEYGDTKASKFAYPFLDNALLAEPYKVAVVDVTNAVTSCEYSWSIVDLDQAVVDSGVSENGQFQSSELKKVGQYTLSVSENCDGVSSGRSVEQTLWVKYVRRELTSLTDDDREAFLDAFATLWTVNTVDGVQLYGPRYKSLYYFATIHNDGGSNSVCDQFHGGYGFINNHMYLGAYLEQSLQLVNPSTCLHYLEYEKHFDSLAFIEHLSHQLDGGTWTEILTEKWFGSNDPVTGRILDGRWESSPVPRMDSQFFVDHGISPSKVWFSQEEDAWLGLTDAHMMNPYGLLRSPWNWNPQEFVSRYNNVHQVANISSFGKSRAMYSGVKCSEFEFLLNKIRDKPFSDFLQYAEDTAHGIIHFTFGGSGGEHAYEVNSIFQERYGWTDSDLLLLSRVYQIFAKNAFIFYDHHDLFETAYGGEFPFTCSEYPWDKVTETLRTTALPGSSEVQCTLNSDYYCASEENMDKLFKVFEFPTPYTPMNGMDLATKCEAMTLLVGQMSYDGDMVASGAALDPLFWVAHGAVERLMQKIIFEGTTTDLLYNHTSTEVTCSGHNFDGTKFWLQGFFFSDESVVAEALTNEELMEILKPTTDFYRDYINFVYDSSDYSYCSKSDNWF